MNSHRRFALGLSFVACAVIACSGEQRDGAGDSAGSAGVAQGGLAAGGTSSAAGGGGHTENGGQGSVAGSTAVAGTSAGGHASGVGGTGAAAGTVANGGGNPLGAAGDNSAGTGGDTSIGAAGAGSGAAGEAGGPGSPPPAPLLKNGSFETGGLAGWQTAVTPNTVGKAIYAQWGSSTGVSIDGMYEVSFWNGTYSFTGDLHQTVTGLQPGKYTLSLYIAYGAGINAAYLYAIGCGPEDIHQDLPLSPGVPTFSPVSIPSINVTNTSCTVGLFADMNTGDWLNADAFVLSPVPAQ